MAPFVFLKRVLGDDSQALVWDISQIGESLNPKKAPQEPILSYEAESEIGYLVWSCIDAAFSRKLDQNI